MASHAQAVKALEVAYGNGAALDQVAMRRRIDEVKIEDPPPVQPDEPMQQLTITADMVRSAVVNNHAEVLPYYYDHKYYGYRDAVSATVETRSSEDGTSAAGETVAAGEKTDP